MNSWDLFIKDVSKLKRKNKTIMFRKRFSVSEIRKHFVDDLYIPDDRQFDVEPLTQRQKEKFSEKAILDLHRCTVDEAMATAEDFLKENFKAGIRDVMIITGGSEKLNKAIRATFLHKVYHDFSCFISRISTATRTKGGTGAFFIKIRKNRK